MLRDEYNRVLLERLHGRYRWENEPVPDWTVDDLVLGEIVRTLGPVPGARSAVPGRPGSAVRTARKAILPGTG